MDQSVTNKHIILNPNFNHMPMNLFPNTNTSSNRASFQHKRESILIRFNIIIKQHVEKESE
ncbi:hypothetical protein HanRHA438_Chr15g0708771 [Helianthus annuus]|nr:hypothetical protein HanIR_Chr15g0757021 [Helianthus annuus]KAJ0845008.1 hypothetical protein HanRHA438_Chr15g0708771 [Helianthus annuus]